MPAKKIRKIATRRLSQKPRGPLDHNLKLLPDTTGKVVASQSLTIGETVLLIRALRSRFRSAPAPNRATRQVATKKAALLTGRSWRPVTATVYASPAESSTTKDTYTGPLHISRGIERERLASLFPIERMVVPDTSTRLWEIHRPVIVERRLVHTERGRGVVSETIVRSADSGPTHVPLYGLPLEPPRKGKRFDRKLWTDPYLTPDKRKLRYYEALHER